MSITKEAAVTQTTITESGIVLFRTTTRIMESGVQISESHHRTSLNPGDDLAGVPDSIRAICTVVWTPEVLEAFQPIHKPGADE